MDGHYSVYGRVARGLLAFGAVALMLIAVPPARAQTGVDLALDAKDAWRKRDRARLAAANAAAAAAQHPLAAWVDYWDLNARLIDATPADLEAFFTRWKGSYVEDRLRNDWLLELGRRRDWTNFAAEFPRFRMNDDRDVTCYALLTDHFAGKPVREAARDAWLAQKDADDACALMATTLYEAKVFTAPDMWHKAHVAMDAGRPRAAKQAVAIVAPALQPAMQELTDNAARFLTARAGTASRGDSEMTLFALMRLAASDAEMAAVAMNDRWATRLPSDLAAWGWASIGKQSAMKLSPDAADRFEKAERLASREGGSINWPDELLAWKARAALRADSGRARWQPLMQAINAMSRDEQRESTWTYWKARALNVLASDSQEGESMKAMAAEMLESIAKQLNFYGSLAAEELGRTPHVPAAPAAVTNEERAVAASHAGLTRALRLISIGLRGEGVREWNYSLRGMSDRELLAAAQLACDRQVWDRCINTSERTKEEVDLQQRFPMPFRQDLMTTARDAGVDPAYVYGVIRQESRFITDARSVVGASGLMQLMPATARWTARKLGLDYGDHQVTDRDINLRLGTGYLKLVLDDFEGSQPLAAAAYNAGPSRSRRWRDGAMLEPAAWAENIPFNETRDYVKKVMLNAAYYAALMSGDTPQLKARLGRLIGPRVAQAPAVAAELP